MTRRLASVAVVMAWLGSIPLAQGTPPNLTRQQRDLLQALVAAVDAGRGESMPEDRWLLHVLRASDGSHYIATSLSPESGLSTTPLLVYVRLATAGATTKPERSMVREWLQGSRVDPRLLPQRGGVAIGDMPAMGAAGGITRGGVSPVGSPDLQAMNLERERSRQRREEEERKRRATLEGTVASDSDRLPFEDFDVAAAAALPDGTRAIQRALTAGPGTYDLYLAWADASMPAAKASVHVARRRLQLAPAATEFGLSSVVLANAITARAQPVDAIQQRAHPYALGATEITPALTNVLTPADNIAVAFQIINAAPGASGKPDVRISPRIVRMNGMREEPVATLSPLSYDASTLPADFDLRLGHPLIAALAAPLATIPRGDYRLVVTAEDRVASAVVAAVATFSVAGTPESLLAEAPPLGSPFHPGTIIESPALEEALSRLSEGASPVLRRAVESARAGRFADLLVADQVSEPEQGARAALTGLALLSLSNPSSLAELQRAVQLGAPAAPAQLLLGAARALTGRDVEAVTAWEAARRAGMPAAITNPLIADAYLRQKNFTAAAAALEDRPVDPAGIRLFAATRIGIRRPADAVSSLDALPDSARDGRAQWLLLHALYAQFVAGDARPADRLRLEAQRYVDARGPHAALAAEWLRVAAR